MANFKQDIEDEVKKSGDSIETMQIVIGEFGGWGKGISRDKVTDEQRDQLMPWKDAAPLLDYEYYTGYGGEDCHAFVAWTENWVFFVGHYDGSTWIERMPRNPMPFVAPMVGGG